MVHETLGTNTGVLGMGNESVTPEKRAQFLALLSEYGNVTRAAEDSGCGRIMLYKIRREDPDFAAEWEEAAKIGAARLEDEARKRAAEGWEEPVWHKGEMCGTVRKFSDTLLICLLKAHHPEKYRENIKQEIGGLDGGPIRTDNTTRITFVGMDDDA